MAFNLTTLPAPSHPSDPVAALHTYDAQRPDGVTKEVVARAAALSLLKATGHAASLVELHDLLDATVTAAVAAGVGIVNPVVKRLVSLDALAVQPGQSECDAKAALAGAVYDVAQRKSLTVTAIAPTMPPPSPTARQRCLRPPALRRGSRTCPAWTCSGRRSSRCGSCSPGRCWRPAPTCTPHTGRSKDSGAPNARGAAYGYVFSLPAKLIDETNRSGGF